MKVTRRPVVAGMLALGATGVAYGQTSPLDGEWWGRLGTGAASLRLRLVVADGGITLFSIDQGNAELPADNVRLDTDAVSFDVSAVGAAYRGTVQGETIVGEFTQLGATLPLVFGREPIALPVPVALDGAANPEFDGEWFGVLRAGPNALRVKIEINGEDLRLTSLDQNPTPIPADLVAIDGGRLFFRIDPIAATYLGELREGRILGQLNQGTPIQLDFQRTPVDPNAVVEPLTQARLEALLERSGAPALAAAAAGPRNMLNLAAGVRSAATNAPVTTSDLWQLGSNTKSMTSTLVARLAETGAVSWDDTVADVLGDAIPDMRGEYRDATLRHLCAHMARLPRDLPLDQFARFPVVSDDVHADRLAASRLSLTMDPVSADPGQAHAYSNIGYLVAATMLETRTGESWESLLRRHVFEPLGMAGAGFGAPTGPDQPSAHMLDGQDQLQPLPGESVLATVHQFRGPAGSVFAPFEDVLRYLAAHRDRDPFLSAESWDILHTPPFGGAYAMGWVVRPDGLWHNGSTGAWYAEMLFDPARGVSTVAACNLGPAPGVNAAIAETLTAAAEAVV